MPGLVCSFSAASFTRFASAVKHFLLDFAACRRVSFSEASFADLLLPVKNFFAALAVLPVLLESVRPVSHSFDFASIAFLLDLKHLLA